MSSQYSFNGFSFEQLCEMVMQLDAISSPTTSENIQNPLEIIKAQLENSPVDSNFKERIARRVDSMEPSYKLGRFNYDLGPNDGDISLEKIQDVAVKLSYNVRTSNIAATFRPGHDNKTSPRIRVTLSKDQSTYDTAGVLEALIHEYVHASSYIRGEGYHDNDLAFGTRCINAHQEWLDRMLEITGLEGEGLEKMRISLFSHGVVYKGTLGNICLPVQQQELKLEREQKKIEREKAMMADPKLSEKFEEERAMKKHFYRGYPTLHKGVFGGYRSNDQRFYCEKAGSEWILTDKENQGVEEYYSTLSEAKQTVTSYYIEEWKKEYRKKRDLERPEIAPMAETVIAEDKKPDIAPMKKAFEEIPMEDISVGEISLDDLDQIVDLIDTDQSRRYN